MPDRIADVLEFPDNTNPDREVRAKWVELAKKHSMPIRCVHFTAPAQICEHNDVVRALNGIVCVPVFPNHFSLIVPTKWCRM